MDIDKAIFIGGVSSVVAILALLGFAIYDTLTAETYSIRKDEFACTSQHVERRWTGKSAANVFVCDQYERKSR